MQLRRAQLILMLVVLVPTILMTMLGIVLLAVGSSSVTVFAGVLVLTFCATAVTGYVLVSIFVGKGASLARVQNDFFSSVSHELRTPLTSIRRESDAVEAGHHRVGVRYALVQAGRSCATEQHLPVGEAPACLEEDPADIARVGHGVEPRLGVEGHDDHQHECVERIAADDVQRVRLTEDAAVVQADDDVRTDFHRGRAQRRQGGFEVFHRAVQAMNGMLMAR